MQLQHAMRKLIFSVVLLFVALPLTAQNQNNHGADVVTVQPVEKVPKFRKVADKKFWIVVAATVGASIFDAQTTLRCTTNPNCLGAESNPIYGAHPGYGRVYGIKAGTNILALYSVYRLKKYDDEDRLNGRTPPKFSRWWIYSLGMPAASAAVATNNLRTEQFR